MDPSPQDRKLTLTIPRRRRSVRFASLLSASSHPSKSATDPRPHRRGAGKTKTSTRSSKSTSMLGVAPEHYVRKTDWKRRAFTELHGLIRCLFCALHAGEGRPSRGTVNRLPDAAARHLREWCAHFEGSDMFARYRNQKSVGAGQRRGRGRPSRKQIVAEVVREYEKVAVAEVFCRKDKAHRKRCAELGLSPLEVEERLERHAVLFQECECCPHPSLLECLANMKAKKEGNEERKKEATTRQKTKRQLKQTVPGQLVHIKEEEQDDVGLLDVLHTSLSVGDEETQEHMLTPEDSEDDDDEDTEVAVLLKRRGFAGEILEPGI